MESTELKEMRLELESSPVVASVRRRYQPPQPKFQPDQSRQLDPLAGCPELQVSADHVARFVQEIVGELDLSLIEKKYSALGCHGYHPRHVLGVLILGSLQGVHYASKLSLATKTDAAYRLVSGGRSMSAATLKRFRASNLLFFEDAVQQTVTMAVGRNLIDPTQLAIDSARLQADASSQSIRTLERSKKRLQELSKTDAGALDEAGRMAHEAKIARHRAAVSRCELEKRPSYSLTDPHAALMKFPQGSAQPGHRLTVTSAGKDFRFVVNVLINAAPNDFGMLESAAKGAHDALISAGMAVRSGAPRMQAAADAGYYSEKDLTFAFENRAWLDVLIPEIEAHPLKSPAGDALYRQDAFTISDDGSATCPAGLKMKGPYKQGDGRTWIGTNCYKCPLRGRCTTGHRRTLRQKPDLENLRDHMRRRMAEPGAKERYHQRIATVEPVFSYIEDVMGFRRVSSRHTDCLKAEILLKVLAYNLMRIKTAKPVAACPISVEVNSDNARVLAVSIPSDPKN
jgi:transposase